MRPHELQARLLHRRRQVLDPLRFGREELVRLSSFHLLAPRYMLTADLCSNPCSLSGAPGVVCSALTWTNAAAGAKCASGKCQPLECNSGYFFDVAANECRETSTIDTTSDVSRPFLAPALAPN